MTKSRHRTVASLTLLVGLVIGLGFYYASVADENVGSNSEVTTLHDCPVYPYSQELFLAPNRENTEITNQIPGNGELEGMPGPPDVNFIDTEIFGRMRQETPPITPAPPSSDEEFVKRIYIDLTGRTPTGDQVRSFLSNPNRVELIDRLLDSPEFAEKMTFFFGEMFRNTSRRLYATGRNQFYRYIRQSTQEMLRSANPKPYSQFVGEMLLANGESATNGRVGYLARAWVPGASQADFRDDAVIQVSQNFLGTPFQCISCHSGAGHLDGINLYLLQRSRRQLWEMSAFFGGLTWRNDRPNFTYRLEEVSVPGYLTMNGGYRPQRTNPPNQNIEPRFILNGERIDIESNFREEFIRLLINDPQFAKATVNFLFADLMGRGIVDPPHGFDLARQNPLQPPPPPWTIQPSHPALLEQLAADFRANNFSLRNTIRKIVVSNAYQLSYTYPGQWQDRYSEFFARRVVRRLTAEQLHDTITVATGVQPTPAMYNTGMGYNVNLAIQTQSMEIIGGGAGNLLGIFEAGNRDDVERLSRGSIRQTMFMMNDNNFVGPRLNPAVNNGNIVRRLLAITPQLTPVQLTEELYLNLVSRRPTPTEQGEAVARITANRTQGTSDVAWALNNSLEFFFY